MKSITKQELKVFNFLNKLKDSKEVNMYGGCRHIRDKFKIDGRIAQSYLKKWMVNYNPNGYNHLKVED